MTEEELDEEYLFEMNELYEKQICDELEKEKDEDTVHFKCDTPALLQEIMTGVIDNPKSGAHILKIPLQILGNYLGQVAQRAAEIDDPKLNILMLEMKLYEVEHNQIGIEIAKQRERLVQSPIKLSQKSLDRLKERK